MRIIAITAGAALLLLPVTVPAGACNSASMTNAQTVTTDISAATKKKTKKKSHKKKEKVEYLRAAPMK